MKKAYLFSDGAARGNPGPAGAGFVLVDSDGHVVFEGKKYLGEVTNNQAEYSALFEGLGIAADMGFDCININLDSELLVKQIRGEYKVKSEGLRLYYKRVMNLLNRFKTFSIRHISRERNKAADRLANKAIDEVL